MTSIMNRRFFRCVVGCLFVLLLAGLSVDLRGSPAAGDSGSFNLAFSDGLYTLHARDALLVDILCELGEASGLSLQLDPQLQARITVDIEGAEIEDVLKQLSESYAFVYEATAEGYKLAAVTLTSRKESVLPQELAQPETPSADAKSMENVLKNTDALPSKGGRRSSRALLLRNGEVDTDLALKTGVTVEVPKEFKADENTEYYLVQFDHPVSVADKAAIESLGARVSHYVPNSAYAVYADAQALEQLRSMEGVRFVDPYHPYYKMSQDVLDYLSGAADEGARSRVEGGTFNVMVFGDGQQTVSDLEELGATVEQAQSAGKQQILTVQCSPSVLKRVIREDGVQWVEPQIPYQPMNDLGKRRVMANKLRTLQSQLDGSGVTIAVVDTGVDYINPGFALNPSLATSTSLNTRIAYYEARTGGSTSDGLPGDKDGHGTHVSGTILGNGALSQTVSNAPGSGLAPYTTNQFAGVAPGAKLVMLEDFNSIDEEDQAQIAYSHGARIANNSWGNTANSYGSMCALWDELVRDADSTTAGNQEYIVFFSAGNSGNGDNDGTDGLNHTVGQPGNAKNIISVGALEQARFADNLPLYDSVRESDSDWQVAYYSSRGPVSAMDARIKPDIVAPGSFVLSIQSHEINSDTYNNPPLPERDYRYGNVDSGTNFAFFSGTSMASPMSAGAAALIYQYYTNAMGSAPSPAMMKAILIAGARMVNPALYKFPVYGAVPETVDQGWGAVDIDRAVEGPRLQASTDVLWLDQDDTSPLNTGEAYSYSYTVEEDDGGFKAVLVWTDPAGNPANSLALVNDLDLVVVAPDGSSYVGNLFDLDGLNSYQFPSTETNGWDANNNVEVIVIPDATPGTYTIKVYGYEVPDGPQDYALAVMKGFKTLPGHAEGETPDVALGSNSAPVVAYSGYDLSGIKQVYIRKWIGASGSLDEIGRWKRLEDNWYEVDGSGTDAGISETLEDSTDPSVAAFSNYIYAAWVESGALPTSPSRIYVKQYNGVNWVELGSSASGNGVSGLSDYDATDPVIHVGQDGYPVISWLRGVLSGTYPNYTFSYRVFVAKWDGSAWAGFGGSHTNGISGSLYAARPDMVIDGLNMPVVAWEEPTLAKIYVERWNGSSWQQIGSLGNSPSAVYPKLAAAQNASYGITASINNIALSSRGSTITGSNGTNWNYLIDGDSASSAFGYTYWTNMANAPGSMTLDLQDLCLVYSNRLRLYDLDGRYYQYRIEASSDGLGWTTLFDRTTGAQQSWQNLSLSAPVFARYLRLTGTYNSLNPAFHVIEWQVYGAPVAMQVPLYLTWIQQPNTSAGQLYPQVYVAQYSNNAWQGLSGSMTYPGLTSATNAETTPYQSSIALTPDGQVMVAWKADTNELNAVYLKRFNGSSWAGVSDSHLYPGISLNGGVAMNVDLISDGYGLPIVAYDAEVSGLNEVFVYRVVSDDAAPAFEGLKTAIGGTNQDVALTWTPASDTSTTIYYRIYRSTTSVACGDAPDCSSADVFGNQVAIVTNGTSYAVTGLVSGRIYCFGVRAQDTNGLTDANTVMHSAGPTDPVGDADMDCLVYSNEFMAGTEPCLKDTDDDGMWDGWEWTYSTNNPAHTNSLALDPLDNGNDRVRTTASNDGRTNQLPEADMDGDGVSNYEEFRWWYTSNYLVNGCEADPASRNGPDPTDADTDDDGMADGWEMINGLNPLDPADAALDMDGDGLSNTLEYQTGSDPRSADSDSDGLMDGDEYNVYLTSPSLADTDGDGIDDGDELSLGTDPTDADSNNSGLGDGDSWQLGFDNPSTAIDNFNILLAESFETASRTNWTHYAPNAYVPFDLWHLSLADPAPNASGISHVYERSTSTAYRVADDLTRTNLLATYDVGSILECALVSPRVNATNARTLFVGWNEYYETESAKDLMSIHGRAGVDTNWYVVSTPVSGTTTGWVRRTADITRFAGMSNVQVRFLFSAKNAANNNFKGWFVDDVWVYEACMVTGWVRDINGRPVQGAHVLAIGRSGMTNIIEGHRYVLPGSIYGDGTTADDGSYRITGLPRGRYFIKATEPNYIDEFYNGQLCSSYGFGNSLNPGVSEKGRVDTTRGWIDLTSSGSYTNCDFELELGSGRGHLGVLSSSASTVSVDQVRSLLWNGSTNSPVLTNYVSYTGTSMQVNYPDWETNATAPRMLDDLAAGQHAVFVGSEGLYYPTPSVVIREGESTVVGVFTNQGEGRLYVAAQDNGTYPIWLNGYCTTNVTPAVIPMKAGTHSIMIGASNISCRIAPKEVTVLLGRRVDLAFTSNEISGTSGSLWVHAMDIQGNEITGATLYVDNRVITASDVLSSGPNATTPAYLNKLRPGHHRVALRKDGFKDSELRSVAVNSGVSNSTTFIISEADRDYDGVGDWTEIRGYTNQFLYSRDDDPDNDGLINQFEFEVVRMHNVEMNVFSADSDGDGMPDGAELGYDGFTNRLAVSVLDTNAVQGASTVRAWFTGRYLDGLDNFGSNNVAPAIECDRFEANAVSATNGPMPSADAAVTIFSGIPASVTDRAVSSGHNRGAEILADTMPDRQDTDGDGMWDGFEYLYGRATSARLDPIECGRESEDPDNDGLSNYLEFLGRDGVANTNDWTDPTDSDTDDDTMPDGWEYTYGLDARDPDDANRDADSDGLINLSEYLAGTNPRMTDTDADGLSDAEEVITYMSDPLDPDTDGDGLLDGREVWDKDLDGIYDGGFFPEWAGGDLDGDGFIDGPTDWDTDGDGMPDGFEVIDAFGNIRDPALNPYDPNDGNEDADGDGLSNLQEYLVRDGLYGNMPSQFGYTDAVVWDYSTDPFDADSDDDGMPDGWEVLYGLHPFDPIPIQGYTNYVRYADLSAEGDSDSDGLDNIREFSVRFALDPNASSNSVYGASTDPWRTDSDEDGLGDGEEDRAFRCNPVLQDSDGDRLYDGAPEDGSHWGEVWSSTNTAVTNHFDQALNDLWRLLWPTGSEYPYWTQVAVDGAEFPAPRWGMGATYIPVFEAKNLRWKPKKEGQILLDNRQLVIMGGRDGVHRYNDVWEYIIRSNMWLRSSAPLSDAGLDDGLSEFGAASLVGYCNSKRITCDCDSEGVPYNCTGEGFGEPKDRPWNNGYHQSSFDWTYIFGGWDEAHDYYWENPVPSWYYKSTDSMDPVVDEMEDENDAYQIGGDVYDTNMLVQVGNGVYSAFFFNDVALATGCEDIVYAELEFKTYNVLATLGDLTIRGEVCEQGRCSQIEYESSSGIPPASRWSCSYASTNESVFNLYTGNVVDVTAQVRELLANGSYASVSMGFVLTTAAGPADGAYLLTTQTTLRVAYRPYYKTNANWHVGTHIQVSGTWPRKRKSLGMVYDYGRDRFVLFGGMNGREVFGDTYEGTPHWTELDGSVSVGDPLFVGNPRLINWEKISSASSPAARWGHSMAYDPAHERVVLFGGFDANHQPLNDLWVYEDGQWSQITDFIDTDRPQPRGGASLIFFGGFDYHRDFSDYSIVGYTNRINRLVLFGGTDGRVYFNDTWIFDENYDEEVAKTNGRRWLLVHPVGEHSQGPSPRAFASFVYAQNAGLSPDRAGIGEFIRYDDRTKPAVPAGLLFGGRMGVLPTSRDTDDDLVDDGTELELGGPLAGRDPRINTLVVASSNETLPFAYLRMGTVRPVGGVRGTLGNLEASAYPAWEERKYLQAYDLPYEGHPIGSFMTTSIVFGIEGVGVSTLSADQSSLWYHRYGGEDPLDTRDVWELGVPDSSTVGTSAAPHYAYSGRWCFGTDLNGNYPNNAIMELYSPLFDLAIPSTNSTGTNVMNSFHLVFHEWLNLKDTNDTVRVDVVRPQTAADVADRRSGASRALVSLLPSRNKSFNTTGSWRRVTLPLDAVANESNLFVRFTLQSDGSGYAGGWYIDDVMILQGAELSGSFTNLDSSVEVSLLGVNYNGSVQSVTRSDTNGYFQFGLLPLGQYQLGAVNSVLGVFTLSDADMDISLGTTNLPEFLVGLDSGVYPRQISWSAVPGVRYQVDFTTNLISGWTTVADRIAAETNEVYLDYFGVPSGSYRVRSLGVTSGTTGW